MSLSPTDTVLLMAVLNGKAGELMKSGLKPEWASADARSVLMAAVSLHMRGQPVNQGNLMASAIDAPDSIWPELERIASSPSEGMVAADVARMARNTHMRSELLALNGKLSRQLAERRDEVEQWLPEFIMQMEAIGRDGSAYDPRPSTHLLEGSNQVVARFPSDTLNAIFRGGVWNSNLAMVVGVTAHGKSTMANTIAANALGMTRPLKHVVLTTENQPSYFVERTLRGLGFSPLEVRTRKGATDERDEQFRNWLAFMDRVMPVYGPDYYTGAGIKNILTWEQPNIFTLDHAKTPRGVDPDRATGVLEKMFSWLREWVTSRYPLQMYIFGQMRHEDAKRFIKTDDATGIMFYRSYAAEQSAQTFIAIKRHSTLPGRAYIVVKKDTLTGHANQTYTMKFDGDSRDKDAGRWVYVDN